MLNFAFVCGSRPEFLWGHGGGIDCLESAETAPTGCGRSRVFHRPKRGGQRFSDIERKLSLGSFPDVTLAAASRVTGNGRAKGD